MGRRSGTLRRLLRRLVSGLVGERGFLAVHEALDRLRRSGAPSPLRARGAWRAAAGRPFGLNIAGPLAAEGGVAEALRGNVLAVRTAGIPCALNRFDIGLGRAGDGAGADALSTEHPYGVNLVHLNADRVPQFFQTVGPAYAEGRYTVGYWAWELAAFPRRWLDRFDYVDEVWAPSEFCRAALSAAAPVPVTTIPHAIAPPAVAGDRAAFGLPADRFVFLFMFDFYSLFERKNPLAVVEAFRRAFAPGEPALLALKFYNAEINQAGRAALDRAAAGGDCLLLDGLLAREQAWDLLACCDAYVSLHRSEGFGLTIAEAMALGKPVIATDYSGNRDFLDAANGFPVRFRLTELDRRYGRYDAGNVWADPDVDDAARWMRHVFEHREAAREVGRRAAADMAARHAPARVGALIRSRLDAILQGGARP